MSEHGPNIESPTQSNKLQKFPVEYYEKQVSMMSERVTQFAKSLEAALIKKLQLCLDEVKASTTPFPTTSDEQNINKNSHLFKQPVIQDISEFQRLSMIFSEKNLRYQAQRILDENFNPSLQSLKVIEKIIKSERVPQKIQKISQNGFDEFLKVSAHFVNKQLNRVWQACKPGVQLENQGCIEFSANCLTHGIGVQPNIAKARKLLQNGVKQGNLESLVTLANFYLRGRPFVEKKDIKLGIFLLKRAGERGSLRAIRQLGDIYYNGNEMVEQNHKLAWLYYQICNRQIRLTNLAQKIVYLQRQRNDDMSKTDDEGDDNDEV